MSIAYFNFYRFFWTDGDQKVPMTSFIKWGEKIENAPLFHKDFMAQGETVPQSWINSKKRVPRAAVIHFPKLNPVQIEIVTDFW
jgi:hypothetical protein